VCTGIPRIISPKLLLTLAEMGHGDEIVIADANFPAVSISEAKSKEPRLINMDGHSGPAVLKAILALLPLDQYVTCPAAVMARVSADEERGLEVPIWGEYQKLLSHAEGKEVKLETVERFAFYERAKSCFAVIATGEQALYANLILKKGVLQPEPSATPLSPAAPTGKKSQ